MNLGSKVRLVGVPDGLEESLEFPTRSTFERCLGREFAIAGFNELGMAQLDVESVTGHFGESIWVEPQFLEVLRK